MASTEEGIRQEPLTERQRQVLELRERGLTPREIGIRLGISTQAVYRLIERAAKAAKEKEPVVVATGSGDGSNRRHESTGA